MRSNKQSVVLGIGIAMLSAAVASASTETVRDFESASLSGMIVSGNAPVVQSETKRAGKYGMKSVLDRYSSKVSYRTEARVLGPDPIHKQEYWYGFSIYLPSDFVPDPVAWEIVAQWHNNPDKGDKPMPPVIALSTTKGEWKINNMWSSQRIIKNKSQAGSRSFQLGKYATGRWTDWVFRVKWSYDNDGILEVWKDGVKVVSATGPNTFNDARMPFFKMGIYKGWKPGEPVGNVTRRTIYHDQFRMVGPGGSYAAAAPERSALSAPTAFAVE